MNNIDINQFHRPSLWVTMLLLSKGSLLSGEALQFPTDTCGTSLGTSASANLGMNFPTSLPTVSLQQTFFCIHSNSQPHAWQEASNTFLSFHLRSALPLPSDLSYDLWVFQKNNSTQIITVSDARRNITLTSNMFCVHLPGKQQSSLHCGFEMQTTLLITGLQIRYDCRSLFVFWSEL